MPIFSSRITVFFEGPFWVCVYEQQQGEALCAAKRIFGAEPKDAEIYACLLAEHASLRFGPVVEGAKTAAAPKNPKRMQRRIKRALAPCGTGTKAQQALSAARAQGKAQRQQKARQKRREEKENKFKIKQQKNKEKHKGR